MLRAVLLGVLSLSAVACKSNTESVKVEPGATAGKVIEVSGVVTAFVSGEVRTAGRRLEVGDTVTAGETIDTGTDGRISFELSHNRVRVDLGPNVQKRLPQTLGWNEPRRNENAKPTDQDTSAAGRPAERSAADTAATAGAPKSDRAPAKDDKAAEAAPSMQPPPPPVAAQPAPDMKPPATKGSAPHGEGTERAKAPIAPRAPRDMERDKQSRSLDDDGVMAPQLQGVAAIGGAADPTGEANALLSTHHADLVACLADSSTVTLVLHIDANGVAKVDRGKLEASKAVLDCVSKVVRSITFAHAKVDLTLNLKK